MGRRGRRNFYTEDELWSLRQLVEKEGLSVRAAARQTCKQLHPHEPALTSCIERLRSAYRRRRNNGSLPDRDPRKARRDQEFSSVLRRISANQVRARYDLEEGEKEAIELGMRPDEVDLDFTQSLRREVDFAETLLRSDGEHLAIHAYEAGLSEEEGLRNLHAQEERLEEMKRKLAVALKIISARRMLR